MTDNIKRSNVLAQGAEAIIYPKGEDCLVKERVKKSYRAPALDERLRNSRTSLEASMIRRARRFGVRVPQVFGVDRDEKRIVLEKLDGPILKDVLNGKANLDDLCKQIGRQVAKLHRAGMAHGDLTTSNMVLVKGVVYLIDFGLARPARGVEDAAVDLHLLEEALTSAHNRIASECFQKVLKAYEETLGVGQSQKIFARLEQIRKRGRYSKRG